MKRREFIKLAAGLIAALFLSPLEKILSIIGKQKELRNPKEAKFYSRADHLAG